MRIFQPTTFSASATSARRKFRKIDTDGRGLDQLQTISIGPCSAQDAAWKTTHGCSGRNDAEAETTGSENQTTQGHDGWRRCFPRDTSGRNSGQPENSRPDDAQKTDQPS